MHGFLQRWKKEDVALDVERQKMDEALARLNAVGSQTMIAQHAGRLIFALDLTGSREPTIARARVATAMMFDAVRSIGRLAVKLAYFRGMDECKASSWHENPEILCKSMLRLSCETGVTQIARVLRMALSEGDGVSAVVFVGDHCEEKPTDLRALAKVLGERSIPIYIFHECSDFDWRARRAKPVFKSMAEASGGIYSEFKTDSGAILQEMLTSVAAFSAAGVEGIEHMALPKTPEARSLRSKMLLGAGGKR
jgi:hypothetical protein